MKKKYTMEEFKKMFLEAQKETMQELTENINDANKDNDMMMGMFLNMQNMLTMSLLFKKLFKEEE